MWGTPLVVQWLRLYLPMKGDAGSIPGQGMKSPHESWPKTKNIKQKQFCNKFNKDLKKKTIWYLTKGLCESVELNKESVNEHTHIVR